MTHSQIPNAQRIKKRKSHKHHTILWILSLIGVGVGIAMFIQLNESSVYFLTPLEAYQQASALQQKTIRVGGMVQKESLEWDPQKLTAHFTLTDHASTSMRVSYRGLLPDMFSENQGVVVEGRIAPNGSQITAYKLMVKHSQEYQIPQDHHSISSELIQRSLFQDKASYDTESSHQK